MRFLAVLLLSLVLAAPASASADAAERKPELESAYMVGLDIHTPNGRVVHVPLPRRRATDTTLYGRTDDGWLVRVRCGVFLVRGGEASRLRRVSPCGGQGNHTEMLSDDGRHFLQVDNDQAGMTLYAVDLQEQRRRVVSIDQGFDVRAATSGKAYVETYRELLAVDLATGATEVLDGRRPAAVDLETDTVFLKSVRKSFVYGPTKLSGPGRIAWRKRFDATDVSPGGGYVLGYELLANGNPGRLEVRGMSNGALVRRLPRPDDDYDFDVLGFDTDYSVVMVATFGSRRAVVRCGIPVGRCTRVTPLTSLALSLPTSISGPDRHTP